ncbi:C2-domain-containing protein [Lichtheimia hyalospora FSU 10163]|nr:C2-domain-containing protein [Lichtheimia hyalospora FSU 10163]
MLSEGTLKVKVHSARHLADVEHGGKNDPYVKLSLAQEEGFAEQQTTVKDNAGSQASWDETFEFAYNGQRNLYIEVMDKEKGVDELIGFAAIPLDQAPISGIFTVYETEGKVAGAVLISINNDSFEEPVAGRSFIEDEHLDRAKKLNRKAVAGDVAEVAAATGVAVGLGFLGKKLLENYQAKKAGDA